MNHSITEAPPEEIATELYQIGSRLRILSEFSRNQALRAQAQERRVEFLMDMLSSWRPPRSVTLWA